MKMMNYRTDHLTTNTFNNKNKGAESLHYSQR